MDERYQVFISSTFQDLQNARQEVSQALLRADCFPAGMELFPAADEEQFEFIKKVIDQSDYYIIISAGRYGSIHPATGLSYTEMEYDYAVEIGKPVIRLLHKDPFNELKGEFIERTQSGRVKLEAFRQKMMSGSLVKFWSDHADLGIEVIFSLIDLMKRVPAVGWVPGSIPLETTPAKSARKTSVSPILRPKVIGMVLDKKKLATHPQSTVKGGGGIEDARGSYSKVFVVHGHDHDAMHRIAYHLFRCGIEPIVLQDQPDKGRTIIEKFEDYADVGFAIILATPDDIGRARDGEDRPRPRQNVVWEFGFLSVNSGDRECV